MAAGVGAHLVAALGAEGDRALDDRRARGRGRAAAVASSPWSTSSPCRPPRCPRRPRGRAGRCARPRTTCGVAVAVAAGAALCGRRRLRRARSPRPGATASSATAIAAAAAHGQKSSPTGGPAARGAQLVVGAEERALGLRGGVVGAQRVVEDLGDVALEVAALVGGRAVLQVAVVVERALEGLHEQVLDRPGGIGLGHGEVAGGGERGLAVGHDLVDARPRGARGDGGRCRCRCGSARSARGPGARRRAPRRPP